LWRHLCRPDPHHVIAAREIEAAEPVVKRQCTARDGGRACWTGRCHRIRQTLAGWGRRALRGLLQGPVRQRPGPSCRERTKLPGKRTLGNAQHDAGCSENELQVFRGNEGRAAHEDTAPLIDMSLRGCRANHAEDGILHRLEVTRRLLVQDDEIRRDAVESPILVREQCVATQLGDLRLIQSEHDQGQVSGDALRPEGVTATRAGGRIGASSQGSLREEDGGEQPLIALRFRRIDAQVPQFDACVGPGEFERARDAVSVRELSNPLEQGWPRFREQGDE
jgi:hypothetical protein